jgi:hypothetical protein
MVRARPNSPLHPVPRVSLSLRTLRPLPVGRQTIWLVYPTTPGPKNVTFVMNYSFTRNGTVLRSGSRSEIVVFTVDPGA